MLTGFHWFLVVGLAIICIAALKAEHNVRVMIVVGVIAGLLWYRSQKKR